MDEVVAVLASLQPDQDRKAVLEQVRPALSRLTRQQMQLGIQQVSLLPVFDCLHSTDAPLVATACDLLHHLLEYLDPAILLDKYGGLIQHCLTAPGAADVVLVLAVKQLGRCIADADLVPGIIERGLVGAVVSRLDGELGLAKVVADWLVGLGESPAGLAALTSPTTTAQLVEIAAKSSVLQVRVLEVSVRVAAQSEQALQAVAGTGLLQILVEALQKDDLLLHLTTLELLSTLAVAPHGHKWLESNGVLPSLAAMLQDSSDLLLPGLVQFWGGLAHRQPRLVVARYPALLAALVSLVRRDDQASQATALETVGFIGSSLEGKAVLAERTAVVRECLSKLGQLLQASQEEVKVRGLGSLAMLLSLDKEHQTPELVSITESWLRTVPGLLELLTGLARQPFLSVRQAAYSVLAVLAGQAWGRTTLLRLPGWAEFLLDRGAERDKHCKEIRWAIVSALVAGREVKEVAGPELDLAMREFVRLGPHHVTVESQVCTEEQQ